MDPNFRTARINVVDVMLSSADDIITYDHKFKAALMRHSYNELDGFRNDLERRAPGPHLSKILATLERSGLIEEVWQSGYKAPYRYKILDRGGLRNIRANKPVETPKATSDYIVSIARAILEFPESKVTFGREFKDKLKAIESERMEVELERRKELGLNKDAIGNADDFNHFEPRGELARILNKFEKDGIIERTVDTKLAGSSPIEAAELKLSEKFLQHGGGSWEVSSLLDEDGLPTRRAPAAEGSIRTVRLSLSYSDEWYVNFRAKENEERAVTKARQNDMNTELHSYEDITYSVPSDATLHIKMRDVVENGTELYSNASSPYAFMIVNDDALQGIVNGLRTLDFSEGLDRKLLGILTGR